MIISGATIHRAWRSARFTLLELIVAMSILVMLMALLMNIVERAQSIWVLERKKTEIYENARVLFELVSRDLHGLVASQDPDIRYMLDLGQGVLPDIVGPPPVKQSEWDVRAAFVTNSGMGLAAGKNKSDLLEVVYLIENEGLQRHVTGDWDLANDILNTEFNFYGQPTLNWIEPLERSDTILEGVESFDIWFFREAGGAAGNELDTIMTGAAGPPAVDTFEMPVRARIELVLIDSHTRGANRHIFTKNIFFGKGL